MLPSCFRPPRVTVEPFGTPEKNIDVSVRRPRRIEPAQNRGVDFVQLRQESGLQSAGVDDNGLDHPVLVPVICRRALEHRLEFEASEDCIPDALSHRPGIICSSKKLFLKRLPVVVRDVSEDLVEPWEGSLRKNLFYCFNAP